MASQEKRVWEHVSLKSYELDRIFVGKGESAKSEDRPELQEMLAYAKSKRGSIDVLIFPKVDRFARYTEDYFHLKRSFKALGIRVESADERFDDSPSGRFMESMLAATAQFDNDVRSERCKGGMREAVLQGRWVWSAPRGYRNVRFEGKATIEPDPVIGGKIRRAFEMLSSGKFRPHAVRKWLDAQGVSLGRSQFYRMTYNKAYIGVIEAFGVSEHGIPPFVPLVSPKTFYAAQAALIQRRQPKTYQRDNPDFPLRGTVYCPCGRLLTASWSAGRSRRYAYYRCKQCPEVNLPRQAVEENFAARLRQIRDEYSLTLFTKTELMKAWNESQQDERSREAAVQKSIAKLVDLQRSLAMKCAEGVLPDSVAKDQIAELERKISEHRTRLHLSNGSKTSMEDALNFAETFVSKLDSRWIEVDLEAKKQIQAFFCSTGATVVMQRQSRTGQRGRITGFSSSLTLKESHVVGHTHKSPNPSGDSLVERARFYLRMFSEFNGDH